MSSSAPIQAQEVTPVEHLDAASDQNEFVLARPAATGRDESNGENRGFNGWPRTQNQKRNGVDASICDIWKKSNFQEAMSILPAPTILLEHTSLAKLGNCCDFCAYLNGIVSTPKTDQPDPELMKPEYYMLIQSTIDCTILGRIVCMMDTASSSVTLILQGTDVTSGKRKAHAPTSFNHADLHLAKYWMVTCSKSQSQWNPPFRTLPENLRFVDCVTSSIVLAQLALSKRYLCLSYVWGRSHATDEVDTNGLLPATLPNVIRDAMDVTQALGYRYLWVDRYCIKQDDEDKHSQIRLMGAIYECAELTIVAAHGSSAADGLTGVFGQRTEIDEFLLSSLQVRVILRPSNPASIINNSVWSRRGWTFQEALLSRRRLVFTKHSMYWQCCCFMAVEPEQSNADSNMALTFPMDQVGSAPLEILKRIEEYSTRQLSLQADALNAMRGIFSAFTKMNPAVLSLYGIPFWPTPRYSTKNRFMAGLHWKMFSPGKHRPEFPSWSWLSQQGAVHFDRDVHFPLFLSIEIKFTQPNGRKLALSDIYDKLAKSQIYERDVRSTLTVKCWTLPVKSIHSPNWDSSTEILIVYQIAGEEVRTSAWLDAGRARYEEYTSAAQAGEIQALLCGITPFAHTILAKKAGNSWGRIGIVSLMSWSSISKVPYDERIKSAVEPHLRRLITDKACVRQTLTLI
ncbi:HET-domain-containing protein [Microthyrium microscopicum]|uniref:HET-domain-containing protein n=1 Tax=Microthyrium microscopicum TaxID=703497 RepID=A0A6A6UFY7_9PEZI|nr:HET-domain-containing protein [Microthyrium microscopicum]